MPTLLDMPVKGKGLLLALTLLATASPALADPKDNYSIFSPTPDHLMREMTTDRPDTTESPFTVDAGHIQTETTLFGYARSRPDDTDTTTDSFEFATTNLRLGLTNSAEVNVIWQPYGIVDSRAPGPVGNSHQSGLGDLEIRAKYNLWGNDTYDKAGSTALALLPFVSLPTDRDNGISSEHTQGGLIIPFAIKLPDDFELGLNAGVAQANDDDDQGYYTQYLSTASLGYDWNDKLGTYYEIAAQLRNDESKDIVVAATGITYKIASNVQLDAGSNVGLTSAADRINPFVGISGRF
jgi:hypothetical protein